MNVSSSARDVLADLRQKQRETPFLALGQTVLWDEPTKAALLLALGELWPDAAFVAGVHDTDFFAKLPGHGAGGEKYALATHDDMFTRGLWSAAGEMHRLLGSEDVPSRQMLAEQGISLHRAASFVDSPDEVLSELTRAWGWTGIIYTDWDRKIACDVTLADILPTLREQIEWATGTSAQHLPPGTDGALVGQTLLGWVDTFAERHPQATLTELYRDLLPRLYTQLLGEAPRNFSTTTTSELLRFNRQTCTLPRFAVAGLFADPATRAQATDAYNLAVAGSDMYTLDQFGDGATPFDLVVPEQGRGTLRLGDNGTLFVDTPRQPIALPGAPVHNLTDLAARIEQELGPNCVLVGKAVSLLPLLAAEFSLVFHDGASGYTPRCRAFVEEMQKRHLPLPILHPILRVRYHTYDGLVSVPNDPLLGDLPPHLVQALGRDRLTVADFANCWHNAIVWERTRLAELATLRSPRALLDYLSRKAPNDWRDRCLAHEEAAGRLRGLRARGIQLQQQVGRLYLDIRTWRRQINTLEAEKGAHFRARVLPLLGQSEAVPERTDALRERAERFEKPLHQLHEQVRIAKARAHRLNRERRRLETGTEASSAREQMQRIEAEAERERASQTANALRTVHGLPHQNLRPSSWWFPLVDSSGAWFRRVAETADYYLEPLDA